MSNDVNNFFKNDKFKEKFYIFLIIILLLISYFINVWLDRDVFDSYIYLLSFFFILPSIKFSVDLIKNNKNIFYSIFIGFLTNFLLWLSLFITIIIGDLIIDNFPFELKKLNIFYNILNFLFITLPIGYILISFWCLCLFLIFDFKESIENNKRFKLFSFFSNENLKDFKFSKVLKIVVIPYYLFYLIFSFLLSTIVKILILPFSFIKFVILKIRK